VCASPSGNINKQTGHHWPEVSISNTPVGEVSEEKSGESDANRYGIAFDIIYIMRIR
jgi:hypothetical protein